MPIRPGWNLKSVVSARPERPQPEEDVGRDGFSWLGVRVRHWIVLSAAGHGKNGTAYWCVSKCGVRSPFTRSALAQGASQSCEACRARKAGESAPPSARIHVAESMVAKWRTKWEDVMDEKSNLLGKKAVGDWDAHGRPALVAVLARTGLGLDFGWKVSVRDCHEMNRPGYTPCVRVKSVADGRRQIELSIRPPGGAYTFEVDVATGRSDVTFGQVRAALERACAEPAATNGKHPAPFAATKPAPAPEPVPPTPTVPAPAERETILGGLDIEKLLRMRAGLDTLVTVGREVGTAAELKTEAAKALASARAAAAPVLAKVEAAHAVAARTVAEHDRVQDRVMHLAEELRKATGERDKLAGEVAALIEARDAADREYAPLRESVRAKELSLIEAERLEEDRMKALGKADDLLPLLAALQKLGA